MEKLCSFAITAIFVGASRRSFISYVDLPEGLFICMRLCAGDLVVAKKSTACRVCDVPSIVLQWLKN